MSWWDSVEAVSRFNIWMQALAVIFVLLSGLTTSLSIVAGKRASNLHQITARLEKEKAEQENEDLKNKLTKASDAAALANVKLQAEEKARKEQADRRLTPPKINVGLALENSNFLVTVHSDNLIPFECDYVVVTENNQVVSPIGLEWGKVHPTEKNKKFYDKVSIQLNKVTHDYLELRFKFRSMAPEYVNLPGHQGRIFKKYRISPNGSLIELRNKWNK